MERFNVRDPRRIFSLDESEVSFKNMAGWSLRKCIGRIDNNLQCRVVQTQGKLEQVTIMCVLNAAGESFKPVVVFPGKQPLFRRVCARYGNVLEYLPPCYVFQTDPPGVNSAIFFDWGTSFVTETANVRKGGNKILLFLDGFGGHVPYHMLQNLRDNDIVVLRLPVHTSHVLQPLDVSVFGPFKSFIQKERHSHSMTKNSLQISMFLISSIQSYRRRRQYAIFEAASSRLAYGIQKKVLLVYNHLLVYSTACRFGNGEESKIPSLEELLHFAGMGDLWANSTAA